jgi:hypothetical protein
MIILHKQITGKISGPNGGEHEDDFYGTLCCVAWQFNDNLEVLHASNIRVMSDYGGSKHFRNISKLLPDYTA